MSHSESESLPAFVVNINVWLTATYLLFHKLWLIYPGSDVILASRFLFGGIKININFPAVMMQASTK